MYRKLLINDTPFETRVALIEDGYLVEIFIERRDMNDIAGNIYKGRVQRVLPGMQAAFVDIGLEQAAFIHVSDLVGEHFDDIEETFLRAVEENDEIYSLSDDSACGLMTGDGCTIEDMLTTGQELLVQVAKAPIGTKGARVTSYISLPGSFLVLMPYSDHIGISRKIEDEEERARLKEKVESLRSDSYGYIVRTAAESIAHEKLAYEMGFLNNLWQDILSKYRTVPAPALIHKELNISLRAVRDLLTHEVENLIIDSRRVYEDVLSYLDVFMPRLKESVELYEGSEPIFEAFNLEGDISRALNRKVWLKSGGYIVIEQTEALTAIDVNTGRYVGKRNLDETILKTNLEAVREIAYQLRLRDIGGIIIIDFIDMERKSSQEKVFTALREALKRDRSKTHVLPISELGLIQMTRKRIRKPLNQILCEACFECDGAGYIISRQTVCHHIYRRILHEAAELAGSRITIRVNPRVAAFLHDEQGRLIDAMEKRIQKQIVLHPHPRFHLEEFDIIENFSGT